MLTGIVSTLGFNAAPLAPRTVGGRSSIVRMVSGRESCAPLADGRNAQPLCPL